MYQSSRQYEDRTEADEINDLLGQVDNRNQRIKDRLNQARQGLQEKARDEIRESFFDVLGASQAQRHGVEQIMNAPFAAHEVLMVKDALKKGVKHYFGNKNGKMTDAPNAEGEMSREDLPDVEPMNAANAADVVQPGVDNLPAPSMDAANAADVEPPKFGDWAEGVKATRGFDGDSGIVASAADIRDKEALYTRKFGQSDFVYGRDTGVKGSGLPGGDEFGGKSVGFQDVDEEPSLTNLSGRTNIARPKARDTPVEEEDTALDAPSAPRGGEVEMSDFNTNGAIGNSGTTEDYLQSLGDIYKQPRMTPEDMRNNAIRGMNKERPGAIESKEQDFGDGVVESKEQDIGEEEEGFELPDVADMQYKTSAEVPQPEGTRADLQDETNVLDDTGFRGDGGGESADVTADATEAADTGEEVASGLGEAAATAGADTAEEIGAATAGIPGLDIVGGILAAVGMGYQLYEGAENIISSGKGNDKASVERSQASQLLSQANSLRAPTVSSSQAGRYVAPVVSRAGEFY